jgi:TRAP-type mannitol/chloroaromatic compound transport system substrate-binding protein
MKKRFIFGMLVIVAVLLLSFSGQAVAKDVIKWKMQSFMPSSSKFYSFLQEYCDKVKDETGGRMEIQLFAGGTLFPNLKVFKNIKAGVAEMAHSTTLYYQGMAPELVTQYPPFGLKNWEAPYFLWYYGGWKEILDPFYEKHGLFTAGRINLGDEPIYSTKPIRSMEDFKGLKIRMSGASARFFKKKLGAATTLIGPAELYTALKLGTVDACEFTGGSMDYALGLHEVTKYIIYPTYMGAGTTEFLINKKAHDKLPEDIRRIFDLCNTWAEVHITMKTYKDNQESLQKMIKEGNMEVLWLPKEDVAKMQKLAVEFWEEDLGSISPDAKKLMDIYAEQAKQRGVID